MTLMQGSSQRQFQISGSLMKKVPLTRKTILFILLICVGLAYLGPHLLRSFSLFGNDSVDECLNKYLKRHDEAVGNLDAFIKSWHIKPENLQDEPIPFVGNGKVAAIVKPDSRLHIIYSSHADKASKTVITEGPRSLELPFKPILKPEANLASGNTKATSQVINFREGIVETLSCFKLPDKPGIIFMNHTVVAHRSRPNVFLQHTEAIYNGKSHKISIPMKHGEVNSNLWREQNDPNGFILRSGTFKASEKDHLSVSIASRISNSVLEIGADGKGSVDAIHVIAHSDPKSSRILSKKDEANVQKLVSEQAILIKSISVDQLLLEHKKSWEDILHTGLTINTVGDDTRLPNPLLINETLYYVLSCSDSNLHNKDIPEEERKNLVQRLQTPEFCYHGSPTFHGKTLWMHVASVQEAMQLQRRWFLTLKKNRCKSLISEGAEGILQGMLLSFGGFRITESDLRLNMDPLVLHNDIAFHRLIYRNDTITFSIKRIGGELGPVISVALEGSTGSVSYASDNPKLRLYACEAGCVHEPVELGTKPRELPVFVTDPITAILYVSHDRAHLKDLRHTIHVNTRVDHARHMEEVGKTKGLPTLFWVGIGSLVVFFHLFLIQLIVREYRSSQNPSYSGRTSKYTWYSTRERTHS